MRNRKRLGLYGIVAAVLIVAAALGTMASGASTTRVINNVATSSSTGGEAGWVITSDGQTRIKEFVTEEVASPSLNQLTGNPASPGAIGNEGCNNNNGNAAQIGLWYNPEAAPGTSPYTVSYDFGTLGKGSKSDPDPCANSGLVNPDIFAAPQLLANYNIQTGDVIKTLWYYNPSTKLKHHTVLFEACDLNQQVCNEASLPTFGPQNFYEAGFGALSTVPDLTSPADQVFATFTGVQASYYSENGLQAFTKFTGLNGIGGVTPVNWVNPSFQTLMSGNGTLVTVGNASQAELLEGSTSS